MLGVYWNWCSVQLFKGPALYIFNYYVGKGESKQQQFNISVPKSLYWDWKTHTCSLKVCCPVSLWFCSSPARPFECELIFKAHPSFSQVQHSLL